MKILSIFTAVEVICVFIFVLLIHITVLGSSWSNDISSYVKEVRFWKHGIRFAVWDTAYHFNVMSYTKKNYNEDWKTLLKMFKINQCNAVDIGANDGKKTPCAAIFLCQRFKVTLR